MRSAVLLCLVLALAGCLQVGEEVDPATTPQPAADGNVTDTNETASPGDTASNTSRADEANPPRDGINATEEGSQPRNSTERTDPPRPALPPRAAVENATRVASNRTSATFHWNGSVEATAAGIGPTPGHGVERTDLLLPRNLRVEVAATLTWQADADLDLRLVDQQDRTMCSSAGGDGEAACSVVSTSPPRDEAWRVVVDTRQRSDGSADPVAFQVNVTLRTLEEPEPPSEGGEPIDPGWPNVEDAVLRPGSKLFEPIDANGGQTCTVNFVFSSPDNRTLYAGTASHCVENRRLGDEIGLAHGRVTGTVAYCSFGAMADTTQCTKTPQASTEGSAWNDFALIRLPKDARDLVHPAVRHWGGPTGFAPADLERGDPAVLYGNSDARDADQEDAPDPLDPREGVVWHSGERTTYVKFAGDVLGGDSGSPALDGQGRALGVVVNLTINDQSDVPGPLVTGVPHLQAMVAWMEANTHLEVELKTWPTLADPRLGSAPSPG